ncbi:MAG: 50S ribosomal protein L4 [Opitutae bacterium]|nr:50S ribosomal protein L4 [Opitutae bacterium]
MKLKIYSPDGATSREEEISGIPVFEGAKGLQAVKQVVDAIRANQRLGTHSTKRRGEVRGGGKKPFRQKGTGRARAGSTRSPLWSGGGVVFGPQPRDYSQKINAKVKLLALSRALFDRATAGEIEIIEAWQNAAAKTKAISAVLKRIAPKGKLLLVDAPFAVELVRSAQNLERVSLQDATKLNALDLAQYKKIIVSAKALEAILARVNGGKN